MKQKIIVFALIFSVLGIAGFVFAQEDTTQVDGIDIKTKKEAQLEKREEIKQKIEDKKAVIQERKEERDQIREEKNERICENIESRVRTRINRYENSKKAHMNVFSNMLDRLERAVERFETMDLDVTELKSHIAVLKGKIEKLYSDHESFIGELQTTEDFACGKSEGEFKAKLGEARKVAPKIKQDILDIREYYKTTVREDLLKLRVQIEGEESDDDKEDQTTGEEDQE